MKVRKLRKASLKELRVRGTQFIAMRVERYGGSSLTNLGTDQELIEKLDPTSRCALRSAEQLLEMFQARTEPRFFGGFSDRTSVGRELWGRMPEAATKIIERADSIVQARFDLLGFKNLSFGEPIDWHLDSVSGKRTPNLHWSQLDFLDANIAGDKKITWELNRHQYFSTLGQAFFLTGNEEYPQTFVKHLDSWMDQNPPKVGINWASSLEVAFRSISWIWALYFFKESPAVNSQTFVRVLKFLYLNARHLETYLSTYFSPNTHLTGEALGLFYLGTLLPEFKESNRWKRSGLRILTDELSRQVKSDGVYFEQASYYHRYTTDFYIHLLILLQANGQVVPPELATKLRALLDHLMYVTRPDGTTPLFGDDDGGRLMPLGMQAANDFRATLTTAAALLKRADYKYVGGEKVEEALWLLGVDHVREFDFIKAQAPAKQSIAFDDGGYYVMRDGWNNDANYLAFDCGAHGTLNCGHAHADALSFDLAAFGKTLLIDPGTYTYTGSKEMRDWFRSSLAHNTLTVDGQSSSSPDGPFSWNTIASAEKLSWISRDRFDWVVARHDGYRRLAAPVNHTRSILFLKKDYWVLLDEVSSEAEHQYDVWFHFDAGVKVDLVANRIVAVQSPHGEGGLELCAFAPQGEWHIEGGWVSHCYGEKSRADLCSFSARTRSTKFITFMLPVSASTGAQRVRMIEAVGGRAFEVVSEKGTDLLMIREDTNVETAQMASDSDLTWARFAAEEVLPEELVLIGGKHVQFQGRQILRSLKQIDYLVATRLGDQFRVETDAGTRDLSLPFADLTEVFAKLSHQVVS